MNWHLITGEYPPQPGGVSDYTCLLANELAALGNSVTVWCPPAEGPPSPDRQVIVRRELGTVARSDLLHVGRLLDSQPKPRRLLVQWVPHAFGRRALNLSFCRWLNRRAAKHGDRLELIVHEAFLGFEGSWKQRLAALVQIWMVRTLVQAAGRVWVTTPSWAELLRPYAPRHLPIDWLPVPSLIPVSASCSEIAEAQAKLAAQAKPIIGHFGTYGPHVAALLRDIVVKILDSIPGAGMLLLGRGGDKFRDALAKARPDIANRLIAPGELSAIELSAHLSACDLFVQPYGAGISSRNTSLMACLAHGRCIVATAGRLTEPLWAKSHAIALTPVGDSEAMVAAVIRFLTDANARTGMAQAAAKLYQDQFSIRHLIRKLTGEERPATS